LDYHLERTRSRLKLGEFGTKIADHLKEFFVWEKEAKNLLQAHPIKSLLAFTTSEQIKLLFEKVKELKFKLVTSYLYSDT